MYRTQSISPGIIMVIIAESAFLDTYIRVEQYTIINTTQYMIIKNNNNNNHIIMNIEKKYKKN